MANSTTGHGDFPTETDLMLSSTQYLIPGRYAPHPQEPDIDFAPNRIEIRFLTLDKESPGKHMNFICRGATVHTPKPLDVLKYILQYVYTHGYDPPKGWKIDKKSTVNFSNAFINRNLSINGINIEYNHDTPYNITLEEQCYLLILLDPDVNWQFMANSRGVTTKAFYGCDNFGVTFLTRKIVTPADKNSSSYIQVDFTNPENFFGTPEDCRTLFFSVARRRADCIPPVPGFNSRQGFNFHIEFVWPARHDPAKPNDPDAFLPESRLPTIFDPDVPNTGNSTIP